VSVMKITVILCTYNRCRSLAKALESLASQRLPAEVEWDVLVVDNNSNDETRVVIQDFATRYQDRFRYLFEPQPGKSNALNTGIREAGGDILAFIDDDVCASATWLHRLTSALLSGEYSGAGGRILAARDFSPPRWLPLQDRYALAPLAFFDLGDQAGALMEPPFGTNMAFLASTFRRYGAFRTDLGPRPGSEIRAEDTDFGSRLLTGGERLWYEPSAIIYHTVPASRLTRKYFLNWWFAKGQTESRTAKWAHSQHRSVAGVPPILLRRLAAWTLRWMLAWNPARRFSAKLKVWGLAGQITELYRQRRTTNTLEVPPPTSRAGERVLARTAAK
jgi:glycosyltransferase involved in cell wall biosynthesis